MLCHNSEETLAEIAPVHDQQSCWEALEARIRLLEKEPQSGDSEAEADDASGSDLAP